MTKVYGTSSCGVCNNLKAYLMSLGVEFEAVDIYDDKDARDEILNQGFRKIPVVRIGDKYLSGHNNNEVKKELGL